MAQLQIDGDGIPPDIFNSIREFIETTFSLAADDFDLSGVERIVVAIDYHSVLPTIDRGFEPTSPLAATNDKDAIGVAMSLPVLRNGQVKTVIVINATIFVSPLADDPKDRAAILMHMIFHELAHAHDHQMMALHHPGFLLNAKLGGKRGNLLILAHSMWTEYLAERLAASFGLNCQGEFNSILVSRSEGVFKDVQTAIYAYRTGRDLEGLMAFSSEQSGLLLRTLGYALGLYDGRSAFPDRQPEDPLGVVRETWFAEHAEEIAKKLRDLFATYPKWNISEAFDDLCAAIDSYLDSLGFQLEETDGVGMQVAIPLRPWNTPGGGNPF